MPLIDTIVAIESQVQPTLNLLTVQHGLSLIRDTHTLIAIPGTGGQPTGLDVTLSNAASWHACGDWITQLQNAGWNIYFHACATRTPLGKKATKDDMLCGDWAQMDVDPVMGVPFAEGRALAWQSVQAMIDGPNPPTLVFGSGNGFYPLWRLSAPMDVASYDAANNGWNRQAGIIGTFNIDRILKVPGTIAYSNAAKVKAGYPLTAQSEILHIGDAVLDTSVFAKVSVLANEGPARKDETDHAEFKPTAPPPDLVARVAKLEMDSALGVKEDKSSALFQIATILKPRGFTPDGIASPDGGGIIENNSASSGPASSHARAIALNGRFWLLTCSHAD